MTSCWPFTEPGTTEVFTTRAVLQQGRPILLVTHDDDDGAWCFLDGGDFSEENGVLVTLAEIIRRDPSVCDLARLPLGWAAWRASRRAPWQWVRQGEEEEPDPAAGLSRACCAGLGPTLSEDGWELESAEERHRSHPETFTIPEPDVRAALKPGAIVKLLFRVAGEDDIPPRVCCERMWVRVAEAGVTGYLGVLDNTPATTRALKPGDVIPFRPEHVADVWED